MYGLSRTFLRVCTHHNLRHQTALCQNNGPAVTDFMAEIPIHVSDMLPFTPILLASSYTSPQSRSWVLYHISLVCGLHCLCLNPAYPYVSVHILSLCSIYGLSNVFVSISIRYVLYLYPTHSLSLFYIFLCLYPTRPLCNSHVFMQHILCHLYILCLCLGYFFVSILYILCLTHPSLVSMQHILCPCLAQSHIFLCLYPSLAFVLYTQCTHCLCPKCHVSIQHTLCVYSKYSLSLLNLFYASVLYIFSILNILCIYPTYPLFISHIHYLFSGVIQHILCFYHLYNSSLFIPNYPVSLLSIHCLSFLSVQHSFCFSPVHIFFQYPYPTYLILIPHHSADLSNSFFNMFFDLSGNYNKGLSKALIISETLFFQLKSIQL